MAHDSLGPRNQPVYAGTGAPADAADLTELGQYAADRATRRAGTRSQRTALTGADLYNGLAFYETDTFEEWICTGTGWEQRTIYYAANPTGASLPTTGGTLGITGTIAFLSSAFDRVITIELGATVTNTTLYSDVSIRNNGTSGNMRTFRITSQNESGTCISRTILSAGNSLTVQGIITSTKDATVTNNGILTYMTALSQIL